MNNKEKLDMLLSEFLRQAKITLGNKIADTILFGSYARGDYDNESDVDIMVLLNISREEEYLYNRELVNIIEKVYDTLGYSLVLSPIAISNAFFNEWKNDLPFYKNIATEGVKIVA